MKQLIQSYKTGEMILEEVPSPQVAPGMVLVETLSSLVSAGTEKMLVDLARKSLVGKARSRPDLVKKVIDKAKKEGIASTLQKVRSKLDTPIPLGYSCAGIVREVGDGVDEFQVGDRVACGGAGYANHAEFNIVPRNLCVRAPERDGQTLPADEAAFATVGAIALQGVRQAGLTLGERVAVLGLGLLGQLTVQLCRANGCAVLGSDIDSARMDLALKLGASRAAPPDDLEEAVLAFTQGAGADAVIITAASSDSRLIEAAGAISRQKGRVVVVGQVGMHVPRDDYYRKELDLRLSMSYGPGRYDPEYEERGHDYPLPYVRWTEQRNMQAFLELVAAKRVDVKALITHRFPFEKALDAYEMILKGKEPHLAVLFEYAPDKPKQTRQTVAVASPSRADSVVLGVIGAGNFARGVLLPRLKEHPRVSLRAVATARGATAQAVARQFGFPVCAVSAGEILADTGINAVLIATRHNLHGPLVVDALRAGKHVFVEKPLCITLPQLLEIMECYAGISGSGKASSPLLMTGFNRRFSPLLRRAADALHSKGGPIFACCTVNAGTVPQESWIQDPAEGGGRIIGEVCHFVDALRFLAGSRVKSVQAMCIQGDDRRTVNRDSVSIILRYANGSVGTILYHALGSPEYPKERIEASAGGTTVVLDDFRRLDIYGPRQETVKGTQDKGFQSEIEAFVNCLTGKGAVPIPPGEIFETTLVTFAVHHSLNTGRIIDLAAFADDNGIALP